MINIFVNFEGPVTSEELAFGVRLLSRMMPASNWFIGNSPGFEEFWQSQGSIARKLTGVAVLLHSPYIVIGRDCLERLRSALEESGAETVLPVDPRGWGLERVVTDYATLRGFERFAERLGTDGRRLLPYDGRPPMMQMMSTERLRRTDEEHWMELLTPPPSALLVSDAVIHPYHDYYAADRTEIISILPAGTGKLLDVGGGEGNFAALAKQHLKCKAHIVEKNPEAAAVAAAKVDRIWQGDFLSIMIDERYDCITMLDVLEHSEDPAAMLSKAAELLLPGGYIVASIPNIGHWTVVMDLIEGRWDYTPVGITCWTHLRFFTLHTIIETLRDAGLEVLRTAPVQMPAPSGIRAALAGLAESGFAPEWGSLDAYSHHVVARKVV